MIIKQEHMKILTNALLLNKKFSGVQYSTEHMLQQMSVIGPGSNNVEVLLPGDYGGQLTSRGRFTTKQLSFPAANRVRRIYYEHCWLERYFRRNKFDLYHATSYILPYFCTVPCVLTVHDLIALDYPEFCSNENAAYFGLFLPRSIRKATKIIAVSETVRQDIIRKLHIDADKIEVVHHGVEKIFRKVTCDTALTRVRIKYHLPEKFMLFVGNLEPKKNLERLIDAYITLRKNTSITHKLVIVGQEGWKFEGIFKKIREAGITGDILCTGYADRNDLPAIYSMAALFVFPSLYEGFGLPVLEAMACGTPVLIADRGALPEIAGTGFPRVDPLSVQDISAKIYGYLTNENLLQSCAQYGIERARLFSWEKAAGKTLEIYDQMKN